MLRLGAVGHEEVQVAGLAQRGKGGRGVATGGAQRRGHLRVKHAVRRARGGCRLKLGVRHAAREVQGHDVARLRAAGEVEDADAGESPRAKEHLAVLRPELAAAAEQPRVRVGAPAVNEGQLKAVVLGLARQGAEHGPLGHGRQAQPAGELGAATGGHHDGPGGNASCLRGALLAWCGGGEGDLPAAGRGCHGRDLAGGGERHAGTAGAGQKDVPDGGRLARERVEPALLRGPGQA